MVDDRLIRRGADGYDEARFARVFNTRRPERYPAAVLVAESEDDVVKGVRLARDRGWKVAIRAGGHSFPAWSLRDDGLVIDLGGFKQTAFDESTGVVSVTPSVSGGELNSYLSGYGRFFTTGDCPSLGLGGFLVQGGMGMGFRGWGYAAEQIASIDVVTADGELVRADEQSNSDLFWAARGAGPGFCGAITRFHLRTRPVPKGLAATTHIYPLARYAEVVEWVWKIHPSLSPEVALVAVSVVPPFPVPGADEGFMFVVAGVAFSESRDAALKVLAPFAESPFLTDALVVQHAQPTTIAERLEFAGPFTHQAGATSWIRRGSRARHATSSPRPNNSWPSGRAAHGAMLSLTSPFHVVAYRTWRCRYAPTSCSAPTSSTRVRRTMKPTVRGISMR